MTQRYFAIIGTMRTGSNLLEKTIERFGDTACYGEAFNPGFISGPRKQDVLGWSVRERDADPTGFLESIITETPYLVPGFRIFDEHDRAVLEQVLADPRCRRIVLRRDPVESYVSLEIARLTGQWMLREPRNRMTARIRFDPEAFGRYRRRVEAHYADVEALMRRAGTNALQLDYADLDSRAILGRVAAHIGSRGVVPEAPPIQRQNSPDMMEKVENYEEMCAYLGGDFAACHTEDDTGGDIGMGIGMGIAMPSGAGLQSRARAAEALAAPAAPSASRSDPARAVPLPGCRMAQSCAIALLAVSGSALLSAMALVDRIESRLNGRPPLPLGQLKDACTALAEDGAIIGEEPGTAVTVALLDTPLRRLHTRFIEDVFGAGARNSLAGRLVRQAVSGAAEPVSDDDAHGWSDSDLDVAFGHYLDLVDAARVGQGPVICPAGWRSQAEILCTWQTATGHQLQNAFRHAEFDRFAKFVLERAGAAPLPRGQMNGIRHAGTRPEFAVDRLDGSPLAARVRAMYADDYALLDPA